MIDNSMSEKNGASRVRRVADFISVGLWVFLGGVVVLDSMRLEYFSEYGPDAGFLPFWLGICLILGGIGILLETVFGDTATKEFLIPDKQMRRSLLLVFIAMIVFIVAIPLLGFAVSVGVLFLFLLLVVEKRSLKMSLIAALISAAFFYLLFEVLLGLYLPQGIFENLI